MSYLKENKNRVNLQALGDNATENPTHIWIEPTNRCNTRCRHCGHFYDVFGKDMALELYRKIADSAMDNVERLELIGYGEPFMAKNFQLMFDEIAGKGIQIFSTSNGILLRKDEVLAKLVRSHFVLCLSIDGASAETFEFVRPYIKWPKMIETLECIKRNADAAGAEKRFRFRINYVAMKKTIADIPELVRLAHRYGADEIFVLPLGGEDLFAEMKDQSLHDSPELLSAPYLEAIELAAELKVHLSVPSSFWPLILDGVERGAGMKGKVARNVRRFKVAKATFRRKGFEAFKKFLPSGKPPHGKASISYCTMPWRDAYFASDGTVFPCCIMGEKLGDMNTQEWKDIWNGPLYQNLRRTVHGWNPSNVCRFCPLPTGIQGGDSKHYDKFFSKFRHEIALLDGDDVRFVDGFYELEKQPDGAPSHRWMQRQGKMEVAVKPGAKFIRLLLIPRVPVAPLSSGWCRVNGGVKEPFDNTCLDVHFPVTPGGAAAILEIEMDAAHRVGEDTRDLGLALRGVEVLY